MSWWLVQRRTCSSGLEGLLPSPLDGGSLLFCFGFLRADGSEWSRARSMLPSRRFASFAHPWYRRAGVPSLPLPGLTRASARKLGSTSRSSLAAITLPGAVSGADRVGLLMPALLFGLL
eukprot:TRINITY_DN5373_c0_g1_i2.p1 TRINITY_DN5373_c0_g1~~TRINITY_DN5373_c0_g1_i2.p1  ORF type:complete len:119 (-),score=4.04 TRINITY_DN5373_c0_g1_i2:300-656(-)